ncbi:KTSC domain-containing protein [Azoarcus sp. L1K30]|uniref:KTSC domain-containing protein n=1 Tax=Azoarcus sp. L1K30 TaxID=2820277 RepID=UPI001B80FEFD|nr:KTSC domain-containing protein [Azoarcus sp. L1K30]MBR0568743.1 KTSC domain-containing protein [Azoarcus sp. L1K30]
MEMKRINSGKLRAAGYDERARILRIELDDGRAIEYSGVGVAIWQRLSSSASAWSYYRDNIEEEFTGRRATVGTEKKVNPLDDLFKD